MTSRSSRRVVPRSRVGSGGRAFGLIYRLWLPGFTAQLTTKITGQLIPTGYAQYQRLPGLGLRRLRDRSTCIKSCSTSVWRCSRSLRSSSRFSSCETSSLLRATETRPSTAASSRSASTLISAASSSVNRRSSPALVAPSKLSFELCIRAMLADVRPPAAVTVVPASFGDEGSEPDVHRS